MAALGLAACSTLVSRHPVGNSSVPQPVKPVDLQKYLGRWYEIARYEQGFQKGCEGVTADYVLRTDGTINVLNRCRKPGGKLSEAQGRAKIVDRTTNAKLKISFFARSTAITGSSITRTITVGRLSATRLAGICGF